MLSRQLRLERPVISELHGWISATRDTGTSTIEVPLMAGRLGPGRPNCPPRFLPFGDYFDLTIDNLGHTQACWGEGYNWNTPGNVWYTRQLR